MGQKVNPKGLRIGIIKDWEGKWFADKRNYSNLLIEDVKIREFIKRNFIKPVLPRFKLRERLTGLRFPFIPPSRVL